MNISKLAKNHTNTGENFTKLPEILPKMLGYNVLVKPLDVQETTDKGIILSDATKDTIGNLMSVGMVVAMGPECFANVDFKGHVMYDEDGEVMKNPSRYEVGDWIVWPKLAGRNFIYSGQNFKVLSDDEPFMTVEDPNLISQHFKFA